MYPVIVLCGGLGTRLRDAVPGLPKVLAPVAGMPFLDHLLRMLAEQGVLDVVLAAGVGADQVEAAAGKSDRPDMRIRTVAEPRKLGTAGATRYARDEAGLVGPVFTINGDTYFSGSFDRLRRTHESRPDTGVTLALVRVPDASRYGTVQHDPSTGEVRGFVEKDASRTGEAWISAGVYAVSEAVVDSIAPDTPSSLERDVFPGLVGHGLLAVPFPDARFIDIGTPADYARAQAILGS